jgi:hypothetical protein
MDLKDYSESLHTISIASRALYEALQKGDTELAKKWCDDITVAAREIRAWINGRE